MTEKCMFNVNNTRVKIKRLKELVEGRNKQVAAIFEKTIENLNYTQVVAPNLVTSSGARLRRLARGNSTPK